MSIQTDQNKLTIPEAKSALIEDMEKYPDWPHISLIRQLAVAYLGPSPKKDERNGTDWSHVVGYRRWDKFMWRVLRQESRIEVDDEAVTLRLDTITHHSKRPFMPGITKLGGLAYKPETRLDPTEKFHVIAPKRDLTLEVNPGSEMPTEEMASLLLGFPDEPNRLDIA